MKILMINVVCGIGSTGRICTDLAEELEKRGHEVKIAYGREDVPEKYQKYAIRIGTNLDVKMHGLMARMFDFAGFASKTATIKFVQWIREYDPDLIHLHNLHGYYLNIEVLFKYLKSCGKKIIWTLHDCWAFTGHCTYFNYSNCTKWRDDSVEVQKCSHCPQEKEYPACHGIHLSKYNYQKKRKLFLDIENMMLVTPSYWLANLLKVSFLKNYKITVIHNGIDLSVFRPLDSNLRIQYKFVGKKVILGVASEWNRRKGLEYLIQLARKNAEMEIVVIGVTENQSKEFPKNMLGILRSNNVKTLVQWYTTADVFVNPTLEDNYPTTNLEAIACNTPVVTFDTGGSPESAEIYGKVVPTGDTEGLMKAIEFALDHDISRKNINISKEFMLEQYIKIYEELS